MNQFFFAQKAFILSGRKVLLVRKSLSDPSHPGKWEVPGGRMDFGEDVDDHIRREIREEVGLDIAPGRPFYIWQWTLDRVDSKGEPFKMQVVAVARLCTALTSELSEANRVAEDHLGEVEWVDIGELTSYDFIPNMIPVVAAFLNCLTTSDTRSSEG